MDTVSVATPVDPVADLAEGHAARKIGQRQGGASAIRTLVLGAGYLGRALIERYRADCRPLAHTFCARRRLSDSTRYNLLVDDPGLIDKVFAPETIILTAKFEEGGGLDRIADGAKKFFSAHRGKRIVYVSSDAVFDGKRGNYTEIEQPTPATQYGASKLRCEELLSDLVPDHCVVRTSYIFGYSCGELDGRLAEAVGKLVRNETFDRYVNMYKSPIEVNRLAEILVAIADSTWTGILHAGGPRTSVFDFFRDAMAGLGHPTDCLRPVRMPDTLRRERLADTSLDSSLLNRTFGMAPVPVAQAFDNVCRLGTSSRLAADPVDP